MPAILGILFYIVCICLRMKVILEKFHLKQKKKKRPIEGTCQPIFDNKANSILANSKINVFLHPTDTKTKKVCATNLPDFVMHCLLQWFAYSSRMTNPGCPPTTNGNWAQPTQNRCPDSPSSSPDLPETNDHYNLWPFGHSAERPCAQVTRMTKSPLGPDNERKSPTVVKDLSTESYRRSVHEITVFTRIRKQRR